MYLVEVLLHLPQKPLWPSPIIFEDIGHLIYHLNRDKPFLNVARQELQTMIHGVDTFYCNTFPYECNKQAFQITLPQFMSLRQARCHFTNIDKFQSIFILLYFSLVMCPIFYCHFTTLRKILSSDSRKEKKRKEKVQKNLLILDCKGLKMPNPSLFVIDSRIPATRRYPG